MKTVLWNRKKMFYSKDTLDGFFCKHSINWSSFISITQKLQTSSYKRFLFSHCFYFVDFFDEWFIPNLYRKKYFFSCCGNWSCESNVKWAKNGPKKSTVAQKEYLEIFLLLCILRKQNKQKQSFYMKEAWNWAPKMFCGWNKKRHYFLILIYIYLPDIN